MTNTTNTTTRSRFTNFRLYRTDKGMYAIAEGNVTREPNLIHNEGKKPFVGTGMGCGTLDIADRCRKSGMNIPEDVDLGCFMSLRIYAEKAEAFSENVKKGNHVIVAGPVAYEEQTNDGKVYQNLTLTVDEFIARPNRDDMYISGSTARFTNVYETRSGDHAAKPMAANVFGEVTRKGELYEGGKVPVMKLSMKTAVNPVLVHDLATGTYSKDKTYADEGGYFTVIAFRKLAERMEKVVRQGCKIAVTGSVQKKENEESGKIFYEMIADDFIIVSWPPRDAAAEQTEDNGKAPNRTKVEADPIPPADNDGFDDEDEEELPF